MVARCLLLHLFMHKSRKQTQLIVQCMLCTLHDIRINGIIRIILSSLIITVVEFIFLQYIKNAKYMWNRTSIINCISVLV